jgi:hypothetical protein
MASTDKPHVSYTIDKQHMETEPDGQGGLHDVWKVHFTTPSGTKAHVSVPDSEYTAENVAATVNDKVSHIEQVHALGQPAD